MMKKWRKKKRERADKMKILKQWDTRNRYLRLSLVEGTYVSGIPQKPTDSSNLIVLKCFTTVAARQLRCVSPKEKFVPRGCSPPHVQCSRQQTTQCTMVYVHLVVNCHHSFFQTYRQHVNLVSYGVCKMMQEHRTEKKYSFVKNIFVWW